MEQLLTEEQAAELLQLRPSTLRCRRYQVTAHDSSRLAPERFGMAIVGRTAKVRKGTAADRVGHLARRAAPEEIESIVRDGLGSGEAVIHAVRDRVSDENGAVIDPGAGDKRLLVLEPELARIFAVMDRKGPILSPALRCAWDSSRLHNTTKHTPEKATGD